MALMSDQVPVYHVVPDGNGGWRLELAETISLEEFNRLVGYEVEHPHDPDQD